MLAPILVILGLLIGSADSRGPDAGEYTFYTVAGLVSLPTLLMLLFRRKYPRWWFDWNVSLLNFAARIIVYFKLMTDQYPSTDEEQSVHIRIPYPDAGRDLNRWLPLVKWLLALPHLVAAAALQAAALAGVVWAWFAIMFTGRYPRRLFEFEVGACRWTFRVIVYAFVLATDRYPPFRLSE
ncbi:MAG: DUF4389 domain-containing protein [candidate division WOR-3 bacterium]|nr:MAG: DUF4389 domain-containing protein [candidate division WOR-3 bacterium]